MSRALAFGSVAGAYARGRPLVPEEAVRFVLPRVPCAVADAGEADVLAPADLRGLVAERAAELAKQPGRPREGLTRP